MDFDKDTWTAIDSYFRDNKNYLVKHHLDSFNDFIGKKIPLILQQYNPQVHVKELIPEKLTYINTKLMFILVEKMVVKYL